jgi:hypothetical protein
VEHAVGHERLGRPLRPDLLRRPPEGQRLGNVPYTRDFYSALGTMLARRMWGAAENRYKAIAMDCGVLSSGGALENSLLGRRDAGMLLCLCSGHPVEDVWAAFEGDPARPLQRDDIVAAAGGGQTSAENLRNLASELGFGLDRFIFLHADAAECSAMEAACPEVLTLQVPADPDEIAAWLKHVWAFDGLSGNGGR